MTKTRSHVIIHSGWDASFWFAVLSPLLGALTGVLTLFLFFQ